MRLAKAPIDFDGSRFGDLGPLAFQDLAAVTSPGATPQSRLGIPPREAGEVNQTLPYDGQSPAEIGAACPMLALFIVYACALLGVLVAVGCILWDSRPRRRTLLLVPAPLEPLPEPEGLQHGTSAQRGE